MIKSFLAKKEKGQALVIVAVAFLVLLIFVGLAIDGTELFLSYTRLKRAVDAAAVAAANDFKQKPTLAEMTQNMTQAAIEILGMQQVRDAVNVTVFTCDSPNLQTLVPDFYSKCPTADQIANGMPKRKLVYVKADEKSPTYFLGLLGLYSIPITTSSISEAASVDLVIVIDTSMSMGNLTYPAGPLRPLPAGYNPNDTTAGCNNTPLTPCQPLKQAKDAASGKLIASLFPDYDRVAIVNFDTVAVAHPDTLGHVLMNPSAAPTVLNNAVKLHYDAPANLLFQNWNVHGNAFNWINPDDRDGNGLDDDSGLASTQCTPDATGRFDSSKNILCDQSNLPNNVPLIDVFDWNGDHVFKTYADAAGNCPNPDSPADDDDYCRSKLYQKLNTPRIPVLDGITIDPNSNPLPMSLVSTCTGCGIRLATNILTSQGRSNSVWVIVFLTDGSTNMSDTYQTAPYNIDDAPRGVPTQFPDGYCGGQMVFQNTPGPQYPGYRNDWSTDAKCAELLTPTPGVGGKNPTYSRYCNTTNKDPSKCPPNSTPVVSSPPYGVLDYALDMTDAAALQRSDNPAEDLGSNIAIYTIGFGSDAVAGVPLLRYMAMVGMSGNRSTDPCATVLDPRVNCGQYYFALEPSSLDTVFSDIASRIYTKITE